MHLECVVRTITPHNSLPATKTIKHHHTLRVSTPTAAALQGGGVHEGSGSEPSGNAPSTGGIPQSNPNQGGRMRRVSGAEMSSAKRPHRVNLRRTTRVGTWNVMIEVVRDMRTDQRD